MNVIAISLFVAAILKSRRHGRGGAALCHGWERIVNELAGRRCTRVADEYAIDRCAERRYGEIEIRKFTSKYLGVWIACERSAVQTYMIGTNNAEDWRNNGNCFEWNLPRKNSLCRSLARARAYRPRRLLLVFTKNRETSLLKRLYIFC